MPIFIYNSYTGENVNGWQIKAHIGRVKNIKWTRDDRMIISCGADGMVTIFNVFHRSTDGKYKMNYRKCTH
jgi:WD40 repeat protein